MYFLEMENIKKLKLKLCFYCIEICTLTCICYVLVYLLKNYKQNGRIFHLNFQKIITLDCIITHKKIIPK